MIEAVDQLRAVDLSSLDDDGLLAHIADVLAFDARALDVPSI